MNRNILLSILICSVAIIGCTPNDTYVEVSASALKKAVQGGLSYADAEVVFDINDDDEKLPGKIKTAALPFLGEGGLIEIEKTVSQTSREGGRRLDREQKDDPRLDKAKMIGTFKIPVGAESVLKTAPKSILWLKFNENNQQFSLVPGNAMVAMNRALKNVNDQVSYEFTGSRTVIKIKNDDAVSVGVAAVEANGKPVITGKLSTKNGDIKIEYDPMFGKYWAEKAPCFLFGKAPGLTPEAISAKSWKAPGAWD